jgi:hypothetical protein
VIERLKETGGVAFGFKVVGKLLDEELKTFEPQLEFFIAQHKKHPIITKLSAAPRPAD